MSKKREFVTYGFSELSEKARERAIEAYRNRPDVYAAFDPDFLTEQFEQDLDDHYGLGELKVGWSLSCCQGDGVCFWGIVDIEKFIDKEKRPDFRPLIGVVSARIIHESRYCHWNSMEVRVDVEGSWDHLMDERTKHEFEKWNERVEDHERTIRTGTPFIPKGAKEWRPGMYREPPEIPMPAKLKKAVAAAEKEWKRIEEVLSVEFEKYLSQRIKEISKEMEKSGYAEIEYHLSDESIGNILNDSSYEYLEDGSVFSP